MSFKLYVILVAGILITSCKSMNLADRMGVLGTNSGESYGAMVGKQGGNPVIGATIGKVLGSCTASFITSKFQASPEKKMNRLYIIDGETLRAKEAQLKLQNILPANIDTLQVLSNAEATALYGNKGQHGAIVINLKKI
ncbi:hypothetical protein GS399_19340 [Pedobacter sp. HMF7647]|uniref:TonB-dependent receptor plug domain-containing protein n=1 Tax=Hufsiella arboris TaxID=2695275 RepID=A0A7K1YEU0_9SPHI|nr:hypothetical protein [Hufsiella arboris]MXV53126.1 hypothetical protein [Hufsiella arboris]